MATPTTEDEPPSQASSIMDSLGTEILTVISPVSITMILVVFLLTSLSSSSPSTPPVSAATLVYVESPSDSTSQKLIGSILDAVAFVTLIAVATFVLVVLYYYNFTGFLKNYMRFSVFFVLTSLGGSILFSLLERFEIDVDAVTCLILLMNFGILGVLSVFSVGFPILVKQGYMVLVAVIIAVWFARLPEWTTWTLLIALAIYDLVAVLSPRGPLRILVELASERDDELPALVYEARPIVSSSSSRFVSSNLRSVELQPVIHQISNSTTIVEDQEEQEEEERSLLVSSSQSNSPNPDRNPNPPISEIEQISQSTNPANFSIETEPTESETSPLVSRQIQRPQPLPLPSNPSHQSLSESETELEFFDSKRGIRLGLGDFVFYSVLVGRAAMYDLMTVYACYLAIISGLGCTLILLSVFRRALPALPISISLGVCFYFLTRVLMEPFVVGASTNLVMF